MTRILVVEDDAPLRSALRATLQTNGFDVDEAGDGATALRTVEARAVELVVLDLGLPDMDGIDVVRTIRLQSAVPIVVLTVEDDRAVKISALDLGADDYVTKPFDTGELLARVRALLRRSDVRREPREAVITIGELEIDLARKRVMLAGDQARLTPTELQLLELFLEHPGTLLTHDVLLAALRGPGEHDNASLRVHVNHLRRKLGDGASHPRLILTEPGLGYRWLPEPDVAEGGGGGVAGRASAGERIAGR
ncbi:MAG TPA: response regulator transcription factor [Acidimicrobiia bacterium]|jgi:two-component system KDP operon response regulator KdpE